MDWAVPTRLPSGQWSGSFDFRCVAVSAGTAVLLADQVGQPGPQPNREIVGRPRISGGHGHSGK
eukprot:883358-Lingulodinium_polyedra.AAC.1